MSSRRFVVILALLAAAGGFEATTRAQSPAGPAVDARLFGGLKYRMVGPSRGGRVTTVTGNRREPGTFYLGASGGGVFKTTDYGVTWKPVTDGFLDTGSIGAIEVAESNPDIVYVGTGSDGIRSNVIQGTGVYRSNDGGKTWASIGLRDVGQISDVRVNPGNPEVVFVGAQGIAWAPNPERGVYRSNDGGKTWKKVLYVNETLGASAVVMNPANPNELYAALWLGQRKPWTIISGSEAKGGAGIYKTTDGGETWTKLTAGLPAGLIGKIDLDLSPANPKRVYALIEAPGDERALYRTDDSGATWTRQSNDLNLLRRPFYYTNVHAHPKDADTVFVNNEGFFKSTDGGKTFKTGTTPHGDNHSLWINPENPDIMIQSNDGGANVTTNGGVTWSSQMNQPTAEIYAVETDDQFPYRLYGAQQDTGWPIIVPSLPPFAHSYADPLMMQVPGPGCETGPVKPKPGAPHIVYGVCKGEFYRMNMETGQEQSYWIYPQNRYGQAASAIRYRMQRITPFEISPHDPNVIYHGSQFLHRTTDGGQTWDTISPDLTAHPEGTQGISGEPITRDITGEEIYSTIYAIEESRLEEGVIWVGTNDGLVQLTRDGGRTWTNVTPKGMPPMGRVQSIDDSPHRKGSALVSYYRTLLGEFKPYIYKTDDYGATWTLLTDGKNGIPGDYPTRVAREDPGREGLIYAGTEFGMFISFNGGKTWQSFQLNLPVTPVTDLKVYRGDLAVSTMGRSLWILDNVVALHQLAKVDGSAVAALIAPPTAYRLRYDLMNGAADPQFIEPGAIIDYALKADATGSLRLEVLDSAGAVIRSFEGGPGQTPETTQGMRAPERRSAGTPRLSGKAGAHRFIWDLRHNGVPGMRGMQGPMVAPGDYRVRLSMGAFSEERPLKVVSDPRLAKDGVTDAMIAEQTKLLLDIRQKVGDAQSVLQQLNEARVKAQGDRTAAGASKVKAIDAVIAKIQTAGGSYPQPMLIDQFANVSRMLGQADQKPGRDAYERFNDLVRELEAVNAEASKATTPAGSGRRMR
jgi:photosystem II stability/assembly factor-like uncharacterized protein